MLSATAAASAATVVSSRGAVGSNNRFVSAIVGGVAGLTAAALSSLPRSRPTGCAEKDPPAPPHAPFWFKPKLHGFDIPSVRRGYEVYRQVCATCHAMESSCFRHMTNTVYPERRVKEIAASFDVMDGPNDSGEMFERPGGPLDAFPSPYPNEAAARYANNGSVPPDLSLIAAARHGGVDYLFALLTGYREPPAGIKLRSGLYYNTYFPGGAISMPPPLENGQIEYEDGTPATKTQMAKDVCQFLCWAQDPMHDERKLMGLKVYTVMWIMAISTGLWYRLMWMTLRSRRIDFGKTVL
jgi:ubiquinol-cytochrome c reductase cytochrome c1 subunit